MPREIYFSYVIGHGGDCVQVGERWFPEYSKVLPVFRNVRTRWWWPFNTKFGSEFPGEISLLEVHDATPAHLYSTKPRRVSAIRKNDNLSTIRADRYRGPAKTPTVMRQTPAHTEAEMRYAERPSASPSDPYTTAPETPLWRETPKPWGSGGGGDFGGGGASGSWEEDPKPAAVRFAADTNYEPQVTTPAIDTDFGIKASETSSWESSSTVSSSDSSTVSSSDSSSDSTSSPSD